MYITTTEGGLIHKQMHITTPNQFEGGGATYTCVMLVTTPNDFILRGYNMHAF